MLSDINNERRIVMKEIRINVTYDLNKDDLDDNLKKLLVFDQIVRELMQTIGAKWTGQGFDITKEIRDISYVINVNINKE